MSAAKVKMRGKKMRNQPSSVQYVESGTQNGGGGDEGPSSIHPSKKGRQTPTNGVDGSVDTRKMVGATQGKCPITSQLELLPGPGRQR
ncbi:hypothetical protein F7725_019146 [Dissostichus mawsoni]|uniref:Uncharacterized protein n=1 Tax=Dissostichus mawsoni TaxID=36200 RepID=A0A7J5XVC0_DISMA|nr:hypothetical protein F7725_019146 [Dissostichus mawsoni]